MPEELPPTTCSNCGGDGIDDGEICRTCVGSGSEPIAGVSGLLNKLLLEKLDDVVDKVNDIKEKVDEIKEVVDAL